jgi:cytochrome c553
MTAIREIAKGPRAGDSPQEQLDVALRRWRCTACHERGGQPPRLSQRMETFGLVGRDQTVRDVLPPSLDGIGKRLTPQWLRKVLVDHARVRPWLDARMPLYDAADVEPLITLMIRADGLDPDVPEPAAPPMDRHQREQARFLIGRTGLNCVGCHDFGAHQATGVRAPDLATVGERLRFEWFRRWMHDPQAMAPGTRMPTIFFRGQSVLPQVLGGREETQVHALWSYLSEQEGRLPPLFPSTGATAIVGGETDTPIPTEGPLLFHGFLPNHAGLRGVALGFPSGTHFAWDTEACRLTRVWRGPFVRQAGWEGSGKGGVEANALSILGEIIWRDDGGPAIRCATGAETSPSSVRFEECWATRNDAGFTWRVKTGEGEFRMEERLEPMPALGLDAFRRRIAIDGLPAKLAVWQRVFAALRGDVDLVLPQPATADWLRLPSGSHDWLVCLASDVDSAMWTVENEHDRTTTRSLLVHVPPASETRRIALEIVSLRVERGAPPPVEKKSLFDPSGASP